MPGRDPDSNPFQKRESSTENIRKRFFFVFEGRKTEPNYFELIKNNKSLLGIKDGIEIISLKKYGVNANETDLDYLIELASFYRKSYKYKIIQIDFFLDVMLNPLEKYYHDKKKEHVMHDLFEERKKAILKVLTDENICKTSVNKNNYDTVINRCLKLIEENFPDNETKNISNKINYKIINPESLLNFENNDKFCVIRDRDYHRKYFTSEMYKSSVKFAKTHEIDLFITNPMFEYWLLLHHEEDDCSFDNLRDGKFDEKEYKRIKEMIQNKLDVLEGRRNKSDFNENWHSIVELSEEQEEILRRKQKNIYGERADFYIEHMKNAITRSEKRTTDIDQLETRVGTMMGLLFKKMLE